jgi:hypothetical protein
LIDLDNTEWQAGENTEATANARMTVDQALRIFKERVSRPPHRIGSFSDVLTLTGTDRKKPEHGL